MDEEIEVKQFEITWKNVGNKGVIFYGPTGSGKTTLLKYFMFMLRTYFPTAYAFAPTNEEKHELDKIVPPMFVYENLTADMIKNIYTRQRAISSIYKLTDDYDSLQQLYLKLNRVMPTSNAQIELKQLDINAYKLRKKVNTNPQKMRELDALVCEKKKNIYKKTLKSCKIREKIAENENEKIICKYINTIPYTLILFEDATIELQQIIKQGKKTGDETIKNFLFKGRWANITHFYIFHDDKGVDTDIRKNAHISIFTNKQVALSFFTRPSNGFTPSQRKKAERVIHAVFNEDGRGLFPAYSKLIYIREKDEFMYIVAKEVGDFKIGAKKLHDLSEQMKKRDMINKNNKYYCKFIKAA